MINIVKELSVEDNSKRLLNLKETLTKRTVDFSEETGISDGQIIRNIVIGFGSGKKRLVIGAHHDSVEGSTGANDNASGMAVLIKLAENDSDLLKEKNVDLVFFDHEETGALGSKLYIQNSPGNNISAMINLDICGVGNHIITGPETNWLQNYFSDSCSHLKKAGNVFSVLEMLPPGDDRIFEEAGIINISVGIVEEKDVKPMSMLFNGKQKADKKDYPSIIETMHNGTRDSLAVIDPESLEKVYKFTKNLVELL